MKINKSNGNLQKQLAKMLQAGMENVEQETAQQDEQKTPQQAPQEAQQKEVQNAQQIEPQEQQELHANVQENNEVLHANIQANNSQDVEEQDVKPKRATTKRTTSKRNTRSIGSFQRPQTSRKNLRSSKASNSKQNEDAEERGLNAAQRHEVPDRNAKYAGEPIKSVGCRMPVTLYARMLQYKALNDSQLNRITLNDIIIEAVEKFMDENK